MNKLIDNRPFIKTAFIDQMTNTAIITRMNQTTKKMYKVGLPCKTWIEFKKTGNVSSLKLIGLTGDQINFLVENKLRFENRN